MCVNRLVALLGYISVSVTAGCSRAVLLNSSARDQCVRTDFDSVRIEGLLRRSCNKKQWDEKEKRSILN